MSNNINLPGSKDGFHLFEPPFFANGLVNNQAIAKRVSIVSLFGAAATAQAMKVATGDILIVTFLESGHRTKNVSPATRATGFNQITRDTASTKSKIFKPKGFRFDWKTFTGSDWTSDRIRINIDDIFWFDPLQQYEIMHYYYLSTGKLSKINNIKDIYLANFYPAMVGKPEDTKTNSRARKDNPFFPEIDDPSTLSLKEIHLGVEKVLTKYKWAALEGKEPSESYIKYLVDRTRSNKELFNQAVYAYEAVLSGIVNLTNELDPKFFEIRQLWLALMLKHMPELSTVKVEPKGFTLASIPGYALTSKTGQSLLKTVAPRSVTEDDSVVYQRDPANKVAPLQGFTWLEWAKEVIHPDTSLFAKGK